MTKPISYQTNSTTNRVELFDPCSMPSASSFLWNKSLLLQMNCRGYAVAQFMQPEPAKYSYAPNMEAKTFIQPEHSYFTHHPGRFFYIKDEDSGEIFSAPYEPVRKKLSHFCFSAGKADIRWQIECLGVEVILTVTLPTDDIAELWQVEIKNLRDKTRNLSIYPYFSIGYMSWMNQSADFDQSLNAIVATCITPYQKVADYFAHQEYKDLTFLLAETSPDSWCTDQKRFEGEGGLHNPDALGKDKLANDIAFYHTPVAVMQYRAKYQSQQSHQYRFLFGPAKDKQAITALKQKYFSAPTGFTKAVDDYHRYIADIPTPLKVTSPDPAFNEFINHWLPRQVFYHGDVNRLTTDPQTRNYLQDALGMCYLNPQVTRAAICLALSQQEREGAMPDGILLHPDAELKYINQVPHADHSIWLPLVISVYLAESNDLTLLDEELPFADSEKKQSVKAHVDLAMAWLLKERDQRGLSYIQQGDWCDPMNMVGYKGVGVSAWLTMATAYALKLWQLCLTQYSTEKHTQQLQQYHEQIDEINQSVNTHFWQATWFARGITDNGRTFGIADDIEGRIYLNPQSWAILSGAADKTKISLICQAVTEQLDTPYGVMMLAPSYTKMDEDIGRLTQKYPGVSENGSVYNHASAFYAYSLYQTGFGDSAFKVLEKMIPNEKLASRQGQLPLFIPNYYRGAYHQFPQSAGGSSHLFNTGTIAWVYRCVIEELCGLQGEQGDLIIKPQLPNHWDTLSITRKFQGAEIHMQVMRDHEVTQTQIWLDGILLTDNRIANVQVGRSYQVIVKLSNHSL